MSDATGLLAEDVEQCDGYLRHVDAARRHDPTIWDDLAASDPRYAAVSVRDEVGEANKTQSLLASLLDVVPEGAVVADLGCGYGRVAKYLLPKRPLAAYIGIDTSATMLSAFRARHSSSQEEQRTPLVLVKAAIDDTLLLDGSADVVLTSGVFLHNPKQTVRRALAEADRILKPGGTFIAVSSFPNRTTVNAVFGLSYLALLRAKGDPERNGPLRYYSEAEVHKLLASYSGVRITRAMFQPLPRDLPFLPSGANSLFRKRVHDPLHRLLDRSLTPSAKARFCTYFDVVARKRGPGLSSPGPGPA